MMGVLIARFLIAMNINFLKTPIYKLNYIDNVSDFSGLTMQNLESLKSEYDELELKGIIESVNWAVKNPDYDFLSLLPGLKHTNEEIYEYLCKLEGSLNGLY